jgi:hypothetical protein
MLPAPRFHALAEVKPVIIQTAGCSKKDPHDWELCFIGDIAISLECSCFVSGVWLYLLVALLLDW